MEAVCFKSCIIKESRDLEGKKIWKIEFLTIEVMKFLEQNQYSWLKMGTMHKISLNFWNWKTDRKKSRFRNWHYFEIFLKSPCPELPHLSWGSKQQNFHMWFHVLFSHRHGPIGHLQIIENTNIVTKTNLIKAYI